MPAVSPYEEIALGQAARLLSLIDRNPHSPTRGSFSRTHWAWKFTDFPYPRFQEGVYALCRLFESRHPHNAYTGAPAVARCIEWGFDYWMSRQHSSGAFDEAYPNEQCLAATAFTGFYLGSAYLRWRERLAPAQQARLESAFLKAGEWLCANDETHGILSNHLGVAAAALEIMARICRRGAFSERARMFRDRILAHQSADGWWQEYDGADIGYGMHGLFYMAVYWQLTGCARTLESMKRFTEFLSYFVHPDGTIGGEYGSRNTEFCYPAGFEILAGQCRASASIANALRESLAAGRACGVAGMDDFNLMPMLNNLWFAHDAAAALKDPSALPWAAAPFRKVFADAGLWVANEPRYYAIVGLSKGGTVSVFDKSSRRLAARHGGLIARDGDALWTSQDYVRSPQPAWDPEGRAVEIEVPWKKLGLPVFNSISFLLFRIFSLTAGRLPAVSRWLKDLLVKTLIRRKVRPAVKHRRRIVLLDDGVAIADEVDAPASWREIEAVEQFIAVHMGSSMYVDTRLASDQAAPAAWPVRGRVVLKARLGLDGQSWSGPHA